jgi:hypothetical protein
LIADVVVEYLRSGAAGDLGQLAAAERQ